MSKSRLHLEEDPISTAGEMLVSEDGATMPSAGESVFLLRCPIALVCEKTGFCLSVFYL